MNRFVKTIVVFVIGTPGLLGSRGSAHESATYLQDCSWAGSGSQTAYRFNVRGQAVGAQVSGYLGASGSNWTLQGAFATLNSSHDAAGEHVAVTGLCLFSPVVNGAITDRIRALATFHGLCAADGRQLEGIEVVDMDGKLLASTGRDKAGQIVLLPLVNGRLNIGH